MKLHLNYIILYINTDSLAFFISSYSSPSLNLTSEWSNPLIGRNITWTNEMAADLRKGYDQAKTFRSTCLLVSSIQREKYTTFLCMK